MLVIKSSDWSKMALYRDVYSVNLHHCIVLSVLEYFRCDFFCLFSLVPFCCCMTKLFKTLHIRKIMFDMSVRLITAMRLAESYFRRQKNSEMHVCL